MQANKQTVDIYILITSRNADRKIKPLIRLDVPREQKSGIFSGSLDEHLAKFIVSREATSIGQTVLHTRFCSLFNISK